MPDLPQDLHKISGFWFDGKLIFCGLTKSTALNSMSCFLLYNSLSGLKWTPYSEALYYVRSASPTFIRPHSNWSLYVIGDTADSDKRVMIFNPITSFVATQRAFGRNIGHHCTFMSDSTQINVINEDGIWFYTTVNDGTTNSTWKFNYLQVNLKRHECKAIGDQVLIVDFSTVPSRKFLCAKSGFECHSIEIEFSARERLESKLATLNGIVHVLGGSETRVDQLGADGVTGDIKVTSAKNGLKGPRYQFAIVEVPESFFHHN